MFDCLWDVLLGYFVLFFSFGFFSIPFLFRQFCLFFSGDFFQSFSAAVLLGCQELDMDKAMPLEEQAICGSPLGRTYLLGQKLFGMMRPHLSGVFFLWFMWRPQGGFF